MGEITFIGVHPDRVSGYPSLLAHDTFLAEQTGSPNVRIHHLRRLVPGTLPGLPALRPPRSGPLGGVTC